jgi:hypothetical protein
LELVLAFQFRSTECEIGGAVTENETLIVFGEPEAPGADTVMWPVYVPGSNPATPAVICSVAGALPLAGETLSHAASVEAEKVRVPPPVFLTSRVCGAGSLPPCCAEKDKLTGATLNAGTGAFTVTVADADFVGSEMLVAVTVAVVSTVTVGALNRPLPLTVPAVDDHVTDLSAQLVTFAVNCCVAPEETVAVVGVTETAIAPDAVRNE